MQILQTLSQTSLDVHILWTSVFLRMASYSLTNQVLTLFLKQCQISESQIGWFMTLTLVGDTVISYVLTWNADILGRRNIMIVGSLMMLVSGLVFATSTNFTVLLVAAILGVVSPSGDETGPFKTVEEASIAHLTPAGYRPEVFAIYGVFATTGAALGSLVCGFVVDYLHQQLEFELVRCYQVVFYVYAAVAMVKFAIMWCLSSKCEIYSDNSPVDETSTLIEGELQEEEEEEDEDEAPLKRGGHLSPQTRHYLSKLMVIFMLDSLGYGFMPSAWIVYYLKLTFKLSAAVLGTLFFVTNSLDAISLLPSAYLAKKWGPVKAMLFTQAPSAILFALITYCHSFPLVAILLVLYSPMSTMDVVPRQVLLTSIMPKQDITKVMGTVNIGKTMARCVGPIITGKLAEHNRLNLGFLINCVCLILADTVLAINFIHLDHEIIQTQRIDS